MRYVCAGDTQGRREAETEIIGQGETETETTKPREKKVTRNEAHAITRDRLFRWSGALIKEVATPVLLMSVGHGPNKGTVHLSVTEDMPTEHVLQYLLEAVRLLSQGKVDARSTQETPK